MKLGSLLLLLIPASVTVVAAAEIRVPTDFATIQSAIDAAQPGDTIRVKPGTYTEQLTISKDLAIIGSGAESTTVSAPAVLNPRQVNPRPGRAVIVEVFNGAVVRIEQLAIAGPSGTGCISISPPGGLAGVSVMQGATLDLDFAAIKGCTREAMLIGLRSFIPGGPEVGHATVTRTQVTDYLAIGLQAGGPGTTLRVAHSVLVGAADSAFVGQAGVFFSDGAAAVIEHNSVSQNLCDDPDCGPDFLNQVQAGAIVAADAAAGSVIFSNEVFDNDVGIVVAGSSGCCRVSHNTLTDNRFFGVILVDGDHASSHDKISGGNVGVAVIAISADTTGTLRHDKIDGAQTPVQELSCCGPTATAVVIH